MTYLVPFDGSDLSEAALAKAQLHALALDDVSQDVSAELVHQLPVEVIAVSIIPDNARYARDVGWINEGEAFDIRDVAEQLHTQVTELAPEAQFMYERVGSGARSGIISQELRGYAETTNADTVFIGSENAGRIVSSVSSVSRYVVTGTDYDVCIVRHPLEPEVKKRLKSDFFLT